MHAIPALQSRLAAAALRSTSEWWERYRKGAIDDWNTCDWLCVWVFGPPALVDLAPAGDGNFAGFSDMLLAVCARNVVRSERFAQTGVGWVLRELSRAEPERVAAFVRDHARSMSREAARSAVRKLPEPAR